MVKVSVVIPVYNVENYLEDCLNSIVNQTLTDIEIICINDGSTDNSQEILEIYAKKDERISVYTQKNQGHAVATNRGMTYATGEYLYLMDSDDIIKDNALELTYKKAKETDVDFVIFKAINYDNQKGEYYETQSYSMKEIHRRTQDKVFRYDDVMDLIFIMSVTPWSKLYKRQFIEDNNILFPEGLIFDDNVFFWDVLFSADKMIFLDEFLFTRRFYKTSSTNNGDLRFLDSIEINNLIWDRFIKYGHFEEHKNTLYNMKVLSLYTRFTKIRDEYKNEFFHAMKESYKSILEDGELYEDFMKELTESNKNIFIQVLSTQNSEDFELLRESYSSILKSRRT